MIRTDKPIELANEDKLERANFAHNFGDALLAYDKQDSIVTAVYGDWGSGKSSVVNMALERIAEQSAQKAETEKPIIIRFNPWSYADQGQLIALFFESVAYELQEKYSGEKVKEIAQKFTSYALALGTLVADPTAVTALVLTKKLLDDKQKPSADKNSRDIAKIRAELNDLLSGQSRKIIVVIDDIDRLTSTEIRQVFQLVKKLGNFPNTIYVLEMDRKVATKALDENGDRYLEKIVQFQVELPPISKYDLDKILSDKLRASVENIHTAEEEDSDIYDIYSNGVRHYLRTIRDVNRYVNTFSFGWAMVRDEVHGLDFMAITAFQVFEPELHAGIRDNKDIFTGTLPRYDILQEALSPKIKQRYKDVLDRAKILTGDKLETFIKKLFPALEELDGGSADEFDPSPRWRKESRVCHPDVFDTYFKLSISSGEIPKSEMKRIFSLAKTKGGFANTLTDLIEDGRILRFLDIMPDYITDELNDESVQNIVSVLIDIGDTFPEDEPRALSIGTPSEVINLIRMLLERYDNQEKRFTVIKTAMEQAEHSIYTLVKLATVLGQQHGKFLHPGDNPKLSENARIVSAAQLEELERITVHRIGEWSLSKQMREHPRLGVILLRWKEWLGEGDEQKQKIDRYIKDVASGGGIIHLMAAFIESTYSFGDGLPKRHPRINLDNLGKFISVKEIEPQIREWRKSSSFNKLSESHKEVINLFIRKLDGKPDEW